MDKSPSRRSRRASPGRKVPAAKKTSPSPVRRSRRQRSKSRNRATREERQRSQSRNRAAREERQLSPLRTRTKTRKSPKATVTHKPSLAPEFNSKIFADIVKSSSVEREEVVRNSMSRFDDIASEAVVTLRRSNRIAYSTQEADIRGEIEKEVKTVLKENNIDLEDEEEEYYKKREHLPYKRDNVIKEFGGTLGVLFLMPIIPITVIGMQLACTKVNCTMKEFIIPTAWRKYFDLEASYYYITFLISQMILSTLPIGFHTHSTSGKYLNLTYRCNGLISAVLTLGGIFGLHRLGYVDCKIVLEKSLQMCVVASVSAFLISALLHIAGKTTNPLGKSDSKIYNFWVGRQISPRLGPLDIKLALIRISLISTICHNCIMIAAECEGKTEYLQYGTSSIFTCVLQNLFCLDFLIFESSYLNSFMIQREGAGYMLIMSLAVYPFFVTLLPKYLYFNSVNNSLYVMGAILFFYSLGYTLFRLSNAQKAAFKKNSYAVQISDVYGAGVEVVTGSDGRRLLAGGAWGRVRHPNHLGVLMMVLALCPLVAAGPFHWVPLLPSALISAVLVHRARRDSAQCAVRYGSAWQRYASKVKYEIIPWVY